MTTPNDIGCSGSLADWRNARDAFRKLSDATPSRMLPGGGWDRCVRMWDDFDRIVKHMEKSANETQQPNEKGLR